MKATIIDSTGVTSSNDNSLTDYLKKKMLKETLRYAAGQQMFCKNCGAILDWETTVVLNAKKDEKSATFIVCDKCYNPAGLKQLEAKGFTVEVDKWES